MLGSTIVGRDLSDRRLGFYFSRPLRGWTIFLGKLGGVLAVALGSTALVLTPSVVAGRRLPLFVSFWSSTARPLAPAGDPPSVFRSKIPQSPAAKRDYQGQSLVNVGKK